MDEVQATYNLLVLLKYIDEELNRETLEINMIGCRYLEVFEKSGQTTTITIAIEELEHFGTWLYMKNVARNVMNSEF